MFHCFDANFRAFEQNLRKIRGQEARARRKLCPTQIFRDVKRDTLDRVETLVEGPVANVSCVVQDKMAVELAPAQDWDPAKPVMVDGVPCSVIHAEPDKLWLAELPDSAKPSSQVAQPKLVGSVHVQDFFRALE